MSFWIRLAGQYPATEIAAHSPITYETWADGGSGSASWEFGITARSQHQALRVRQLVEVMLGPVPLFSGLLTDYDRLTGKCVAYGMASAAQKFPALDGGGAATRDLATAISTAQGMGLPTTNPTPVSGTAAGDATGNPIPLSQLVTEYAEQTGQRWGVDERRRWFVRPDPTAPTWLTSPGAAAFGNSDEDRATRLLGRYLDSTSGVYAKADAGSGWPVETVDLTDRGAITNTAAVAILDGMLARTHAGPAWTNGVTLNREQFTTMGGTPAFLPAVRGGQLVRSFGLANAVNALSLDTVIGKTSYTTGEDVIYIEPTSTVPRDFTSVLEAS